MSLYAIRSKETGELLRHRATGWSDEMILVYPSWNQAAYAIASQRAGNTHYPVRLRIEPTEPCEWCEDSLMTGEVHRMVVEGDSENTKISKIYKDSLWAFQWHCCPNCGRSLK